MAIDPRAGVSMSPQEHVDLLFVRDLNRLPDAAGKQFWTERATQVPPEQLNAEFRAAAKTENPQAGQLQHRAAGSVLPGDAGYQEYRNPSFFDLVKPFVVPIIAIAAPALIPAIGSSLLPAGASAAAINAAGSAIVNAGVTAAQGGDFGDILKSGVAGAAGGYAGTTASEAVKAAEAAGKIGISSALPAGVLPAAAGGAAGTGARTLVETGDVGRSLQAAGLSGLASGAGQAASVTAQGLLPADTSRTTQALVAGGAGGATEAAIEGANPITGALGSALQTARVTSEMDAEAANRSKQAAATMQQLVDAAATDPAVNLQVAQALPVTAEQVQQLARMGESKAAENILRSAANDPKFIRQAANDASIKVLRDAGYNTLADALARVAVGVTTMVTPGNAFQETNEDAIMADKMKQFVTPIASPDFALAPVEVSASRITKIQPNESIGRDGQLLENGNPTGLFVDKAGTLYDEAGNPITRNYAPPTAIPATVPDIVRPPLPYITPGTTPTTAPTTRPAPSITPSVEPGVSPLPEPAAAPSPLPEPGAAPTPDPRLAPLPEPTPRTAPITEPAVRPTTPGGTAVRPVISPTTPSTIPTKDRPILNLTGLTPETPGITKPIDRLPEVEVTGEEETEFTRRPIEDGVSQTFPLTPDEPIIKRPPIIDYRSFNVFDPTFTAPPITPTTMAPGSSALAQALGVGDPGVSYLGKKGKERKPVWNVESLKLSDELGGRYG